MARKTKAKAHVKAVSIQDMSIDALLAKASSDVQTLRYKEAIELYKELLKREKRAEWLDALAQCYLQRADELAKKGMFKEALVLWRNRHEICGKPLFEVAYLNCLLQAGEQTEMLSLLADKNLPDESRSLLENQLAGLVLTGDDKFLAKVPTDSALLRHRDLALAALDAYAALDDAALTTVLQAIPARSPYRDLKPGLKALALLHSDMAAAQAMAARLPQHGPFESLMSVVRAAVLPEAGWLFALPSLTTQAQQMLLEIKGCPEKMRPALLALAKLGEKPKAKALFEVLLTLRAQAASKSLQTLLNKVHVHLDQPIRSEMLKLPESVCEHIFALQAELDNDVPEAFDAWCDVVDSFENIKDSQRAALVWQHIATLELKMNKKLDACASLGCSVEQEPDKDVFVTLIRSLRELDELPEARSRLDQAMKAFPKEPVLLQEAVEMAVASGAFKKAVTVAKQLLALDPINTQVKQTLGQALLGHARKKIKSADYVAAHKELDEAAEWLSAKQDVASLALLRVLAEKTIDKTALQQALAGFANPWLASFNVSLEMVKIGLKDKTLLVQSGFDSKATPSAAQLLALMQAIQQSKDKAALLCSALTPFNAALKRAAKTKISIADLQFICEALQHIECNDLLKVFADAGRRYSDNAPIFVYLSIAAQGKANYFQIPELEAALEKARQQGDARTEALIVAYLNSSFSMPDYDDEGDDDDDMFNPFADSSPRAMIEMMVEIMGEKAFIERARKEMLEPHVFAQLKSQSKTPKELVKRIVDWIVKMAEKRGF